MIQQFSIKSRLVLAGLVPLIAIGLLLLFSINTFSSAEHHIQSISDDTIVQIRLINAMRGTLAKEVLEPANKANAGSISPAEASKRINAGRELIQQNWKDYQQTSWSDSEKPMAEDLHQAINKLESKLDQLNSKLSALGDATAGQVKDVTDDVALLGDSVDAKLAAIVNVQLQETGNEFQQMHADFAATKTELLLVAAITTGLVALISYLVLVSITRPIDAMQATMATIERDSDLRLQVPVMGRDKLSELGLSINRTLASINRAINEVKRVADEVNQSSQTMDNVSQEVTRKIDSQHSETEQVATAMHEMTATVTDVARNASSAQDHAHDAAKAANRGRELVERGRDTIERLVAEVQRIADQIGALEANSQNIGSVVDVINSIAEQTNLLALNAAIEAARAGEQGRGFAVVADEVRSLAQRTQSSTQEIRNAVEQLQNGARSAVAAMREGESMAQDSGEQARKAAEALVEIDSTVGRITDMNTQIASAAEQQASVAEEINQRVNSITGIAGETADGAQTVSRNSSKLAGMSADLKRLIGVFQTG